MRVSDPGRTGLHTTSTTLSEINVTPLVDVMLVLLIVFMVSAPLMKQGMQVDLPKAETGTLSDAPNQVMLSVNSAREISLDGTKVKKGGLREKLSAIAKKNAGVQVYVQADQTLPYGFIAQIIAEVKQSSISHVGLVTLPGAKDSPL